MKLNRFFFLTTLLLVFISTLTYSQKRGYGIGIIVGEPTGLSFKGWVSARNAIDAGIAWSFIDETSIHVHADYLWHSFDMIKSEADLAVYYGIGGRIKTGDNNKARIGLRMVGGINYFFKDAPFDLFLEIAPILDLAPATKLSANAGLGARFFIE